MLQNFYKEIITKTLSNEKGFFENDQALNDFNANVAAAKQKFASLHQYYVTNISSDSMAASLELAGVIYALCQFRKPARLVDLGSGFSSFVFRQYAKEATHPCEVVSIDDDAAWLEKTKSYLDSNGVGTNKVMTLDAFLASQEREFDIVLHDMNFVEVRRNYIDEVIDRAVKGGLIIFDDVHKTDYFHDVVKALKRRKIKFFNFKALL
jgi:predicted O-methyltransferase YrrM